MIEGYERQVVMLSLLQALRSHGSWCGETHVQKSTFFLEEGLGVPLGLDFYMYKYGPFSSDLRQLLGEMRASYLIEVEPKEPYGPSLVVSESGQGLMGRFARTRGRYAPAIDFVASKVGARPVAELERLSTALFVRRERPDLPQTEQAHRVMELKPHLEDRQAEEAVVAINDLLTEATEKRLVGVAFAGP